MDVNDGALGDQSRRRALGLLGVGLASVVGGAGNLIHRAWAAPSADVFIPSADPLARARVATGIDYSSARPRPSVIVAAGYSFVIRYHSRTNSYAKNLTRAEANALRSAGLDVVSNWESGALSALQGYRQGAADATVAKAQAAACGQPAGRPIYFAVDFDVRLRQQAAINDYFDGIASVLGRGRTGAYGGFSTINWLFNARKIRWGWQTYAWSHGRWDSRAQLRQVKNEIRVDGGRCDRDEAWASDYGGWDRRIVT